MYRKLIRYFGGEAIDVKGAFETWTDQAHVAAEHVPKQREFVEIPPAHERADPHHKWPDQAP
jgi:hypothetical protein